MTRCMLCNKLDNSGLINGFCTDCYDLSLDIGKTGKEIEKKKKADKKALEKRRSENDYYSKGDN